MWSRKQSVCSGISGVSKCEDPDLILTGASALYPFAVALRIRVLQIVCGIGGMVIGAVGWLEERKKPALGYGVVAGALTILAAATSIYFSRGFGGWISSRTRSSNHWGPPWRALGPSPLAALPLTLLWTFAVVGHVVMLVFCFQSLFRMSRCSTTTCTGVAGAQLSVSLTTLIAQVYMMQLDLRYDSGISPPARTSDQHTCTAVSMVPLASLAISVGDTETMPNSPPGKCSMEYEPQKRPDKPS